MRRNHGAEKGKPERGYGEGEGPRGTGGAGMGQGLGEEVGLVGGIEGSTG